MQFERRSLELTPAEWQALDQLAAQWNSKAPSGPTAGRPSWRTLIKQIADRELEIQKAQAPQPNGAPS